MNGGDIIITKNPIIIKISVSNNRFQSFPKKLPIDEKISLNVIIKPYHCDASVTRSILNFEFS